MPRPMKPKIAKKPVGRPRKYVPKKPVGRPLLLTGEIAERIAKYVRQGDTLECAAALVGVHKETVLNWLKKGAAAQRKDPPWTPEEELHIILVEKVSLALKVKEHRRRKSIEGWAEEDWKATAWLIEHDPDMRETWKRHDERLITHTGSVEHQHAHGHRILTKEDFDNMSFEDKKRLLEAGRQKQAGVLSAPDKEPRPIQDLGPERLPCALQELPPEQPLFPAYTDVPLEEIPEEDLEQEV